MRRRPAAILLVAALALAGCSSTGIDPQLTAAVADAVSADASAQIGLKLSDDQRILPGTLATVLGDMADGLIDTERELQLHQPRDAADAAYRADALALVRASLEALHVAQAGDEALGLAQLTESLEGLRDLAAQK